MGLNSIDFAIIAVYLLGITLFGMRFRKRQRTLRDYFLAGRDIPWWAIALSIVAAETSTLTIISIPGPGLRHQPDFSASRHGIRGWTIHHQFCTAAALFSRGVVYCV